jgi:hypothetical protein
LLTSSSSIAASKLVEAKFDLLFVAKIGIFHKLVHRLNGSAWFAVDPDLHC